MYSIPLTYRSNDIERSGKNLGQLHKVLLRIRSRLMSKDAKKIFKFVETSCAVRITFKMKFE